MIDWIFQNWATLLVGAVVATTLIAVIVAMIRNKKKGKGGCSCGCAGCALRDKCHK